MIVSCRYTLRFSKHRPRGGLFLYFFCSTAPWWWVGDNGDGRVGGEEEKNEMKALKASWQPCYYPHWLRDALSPYAGFFVWYFLGEIRTLHQFSTQSDH